MSRARFQMTIRLSDNVRTALDDRVEGLRAVGAPVERARLAADLLARALSQPVDEDSIDVTKATAAALGQIAAKLRKKGAVPADRVEGLATALDELAGRLGGAGVGGDGEDDNEARGGER